MSSSTLKIQTPRWALPFFRQARYKGAYGGRGSGKSHFFAELLVEDLVRHPDLKAVCIREIQKSLKFSSKALIESKIKALGVSELFEITLTEIRRIGSNGVIIFQGMQDHTAESIKSLEGFDRAWIEEAQSLSDKSLKLLRPTIRNPNSEIWASWNPDQPTDAIDKFMREGAKNDPERFIVVRVNYVDNPWLPDELLQEMEYDRCYNPSTFDNVWMGEYNKKSDAIVFAGKFGIGEFAVDKTWGNPYYGLDWGFANDPTAAVRCWVKDDCLWIDYEAGRTKLELDETVTYLKERMPDIEKYALRSDSARPESISYIQRHGLPKAVSVEKWKGSIEDGIAFIKNFKKIIIHSRCKKVAQEFRLYSYKVDARSGDILPQILDENNHYIDALRYALAPMIKHGVKPIRLKLGVAF